MNKKRGISLIVLIITIVVIIILATAIIVNIAKSNIINNANEAVVKQDFKTMQEELNMYYAEQYVETKGKFDQSKFNADSTTTPSVYDVIKSLKNSKYDGKVTVENGKITLSGDIDEKIKKWAAESADVTIKDKVVGDDTNPDEIPTIPEGTAITASDIASDPLQYYGKTVDYKVLNENLVASNSIENIILAEQYDNITWKIFYSDSKNVYLIAENELKINNEKYTKMFNNSSEAVSYVNTKSNWSDFVNNVADYAVGGPTVTMFTNSWNAKYPNSAITVTGNDTNGWEINGRGYADVENGDPLYYKENMWYLIGSKFEGDDIYPIYVKDGEISGEVIITPEYGTIKYQGMGFRPIVCLKEGITYEAVSNYLKITTKQDGDEVIEEITPVSTYNNPIIPQGFESLETQDATWKDNDNDGCPDGWNDGLVIVDGNGNEFVWVPVDGNIVQYNTVCYVKTDKFEFDGGTDVVPNDTLPNGVSSEEYQIKKYGGFYIARYEAGVPDKTSEPQNVTGKPISQAGAVVWTDIDYNNSKVNAESMYDNQYVKSGLVTPKAGITTSKWITSIYGDENPYTLLSEPDCAKFGNYINSVAPANIEGYGEKQETGFSEFWKINNIYDFYGNVSEKLNSLEDTEYGFKYSYRIDQSYLFEAQKGDIMKGLSTWNSDKTCEPDVGFRVMLFLQ